MEKESNFSLGRTIILLALFAQRYKKDIENLGSLGFKFREFDPTRWGPFARYSNGWAVQYSNGNQKPDHWASNLFSTIQIQD